MNLTIKKNARNLYYIDAGWSSLVARWAHNPKVAGSNPAPATSFRQGFSWRGHLFKGLISQYLHSSANPE